MMRYGKGEVAKIVEVLDSDHADVEAAALACLAAMEDVLVKRAKFTVVGQLWKRPDGSEIDPGDPEAIKLALGWYSTAGDAQSAANSLALNSRTNEHYRVWLLDVAHCTPADLHGKRKEVLQAAQEKRAEQAQERLRASIEKYAKEREQAVYEAVQQDAAA